jgi:O-acetyl-ADP-ribose deacetylase (regulator of RNase III)
MIAQRSLGMQNGIPAIRYEFLDVCLKKVADTCKKYGASVVGPKIGCGLAGGKWDKVEPLIIKNLCEQDIPVYIYEL